MRRLKSCFWEYRTFDEYKKAFNYIIIVNGKITHAFKSKRTAINRNEHYHNSNGIVLTRKNAEQQGYFERDFYPTYL